MPDATISLPDWLCTEDISTLFNVLSANTTAPRFVGGCVRDMLLGKIATDIDIATPLLPHEVMARLQKHAITCIPTGITHGTVTAVLHAKPYEITTLRTDISTDGRRANVAYTTEWRDDAARRDFTINAMYCDRDGTLYDFFYGREDLVAGCVRFVGKATERVQEDFLRILRFFRFYAWYGQEAPDPESLAACAQYAAQLDTLSGERIRVEMHKLLAAPTVVPVLRQMSDKGILTPLGLEYTDDTTLARLIQAEQHYTGTADSLMRLALVLRGSPEAKGRTVKVSKRWRLSNKEAEELTVLVSPAYAIHSGLSLSEQQCVLRHTGKTLFIKQVMLALAGDTTHATYYDAMIGLARKWCIPQFPLRGETLLSLGVAPGVRIGRILKEAEQWWENAGYPADDKVLEWVKNYLAATPPDA